MERTTQSSRYDSKRTYAYAYFRSRFKKKYVPSIRDNRKREREEKKKHLYSYVQNYVVYNVTVTLSRKKRTEQVCTSLDHDNLNYYGKG